MTETEWLERCLEVMALDPETAEPSVGIPCGVMRPEFGPAVRDLVCGTCGATWAGIVGDPCWWCQRSNEVREDHQAELLLRAPDVEPDDATYEARMRAWLERMKVGVAAGIITEWRAKAAWESTQRRRAA